MVLAQKIPRTPQVSHHIPEALSMQASHEELEKGMKFCGACAE